MENKLNKEEIIIIAILAVISIAIIALLTSAFRGNNTDENAAQQQDVVTSTTPATDAATTTPTTTAATNPAAKTVTSKTTIKPPSVTQGISYANALKTYASWRFQFINCRATPGSFTIKKGQKFMLDNRDEKTHTIKVGSIAYTVKGYNFAIATATRVGTTYITCDGGGSASINVQP